MENTKKTITQIFSWVTYASAAVISAFCIWNLPFEKLNIVFLALLVATVFLGSALQLQLPRTKIHLSFAEATIFFFILMYGVEAAVLTASLETLYASFSMRRKKVNIKLQTIFLNVGFGVISTFATGLVVSYLFSNIISNGIYKEIHYLVLTLCVIGICQFLINSILVAAITSLRTEKTFWRVINENCFNALIMYAVGAIVAGLMVKAVEQIEPILLFAMAVISVVAYITYRRYVDDIKDTSAKAEQAERERAELAEKHVVELQHYIAELEKTSTALRDSKEKFRYAAFHDALTDLPNRNKFVEQVKFLLEKNSHDSDHNFAVLFLDLNRFKTINDSLGYPIGNRLLLHVAKRLVNMVREGDLVARFSGDEFAIILNNISGVEEATNFADLVSQKISKPYTLNGRQVFTSVSIGIAVSNPRYREAEDILRDADIAMYHAKEAEKSFAVFDQNMHTRAVTLMQIETDLRYAIERDELIVYYQPIINLDSIELIGFEALMRWNHPQRGLVPPYEFIPVGELTGLIVPMTLWILRHSCEQMVKWHRQSPSNKNLMVSVNLSGKHFAQADMVEQIEKILEETKLPPSRLKLEITESAVMENAESAIRMLKQLRKLGIQISIDDFGTGYSSLSYLHRFPINTLKVDRSFVSTMEEGSENGEIVRTIIALAKALNLSVIAEGIESIHQLHQLRVLGCEYGQGFLFSRPVPLEEADKIVADKQRWRNIIPAHTIGLGALPQNYSMLELDGEISKERDIIQ